MCSSDLANSLPGAHQVTGPDGDASWLMSIVSGAPWLPMSTSASPSSKLRSTGEISWDSHKAVEALHVHQRCISNIHATKTQDLVRSGSELQTFRRPRSIECVAKSNNSFFYADAKFPESSVRCFPFALGRH